MWRGGGVVVKWGGGPRGKKPPGGAPPTHADSDPPTSADVRKASDLPQSMPAFVACPAGDSFPVDPSAGQQSQTGSVHWPGTGRQPRCALRSDDTEAVSAKHQACPHLAVHVHLDSTLEMGATEMGAAIVCQLVGDSIRGTETAEPLTSNPATW